MKEEKPLEERAKEIECNHKEQVALAIIEVFLWSCIVGGILYLLWSAWNA